MGLFDSAEEKARKKKLKEEEKELKRKEFEKIMASNPEVTKKSSANSNVVKDDKIHCPKCNSTQITAHKKGFSMGKAFVGGILLGDVGKNKIIITCLNCGHQWKPGKK